MGRSSSVSMYRTFVNEVEPGEDSEYPGLDRTCCQVW